MMSIRTEIQGRLVELYEGALEGTGEGGIETFVSVTDSRTALNSMLLGAFKASREEVLIFSPDYAWLRELPALLNQLESKASEGINVKALIDAGTNVEADPTRDFVRRKFKVRKTRSMHSSMIITDRKDVYLAVRKATRKATESPEIFVRLTSADLALDVVRVFDEAWESAMTEASA
jgi:sugar-specific transcriptional regulator TrmB